VILSSVASVIEQRKEKNKATATYSNSRKASLPRETLVVRVLTVSGIEGGMSIKSRAKPGSSSF
jgi:hypothetical protein